MFWRSKLERARNETTRERESADEELGVESHKSSTLLAAVFPLATLVSLVLFLLGKLVKSEFVYSYENQLQTTFSETTTGVPQLDIRHSEGRRRDSRCRTVIQTLPGIFVVLLLFLHILSNAEEGHNSFNQFQLYK